MRNFSKSSVFAGIGMAAAVVAVGACLTAAVPAMAASGTAGQTLAQATAVSYDAVCPRFVDADGDGLCDNCDGAGNHACGSRANANGGGICTGRGNGHHGSTLGHHGGGRGHGHC